MDRPHFIHLSMDRDVGCYHFLAIVHSATMNVQVKVFAWTYVFILLGRQVRVELAGHVVTRCLRWCRFQSLINMHGARGLHFSNTGGCVLFAGPPGLTASCLSCEERQYLRMSLLSLNGRRDPEGGRPTRHLVSFEAFD